MDLVLDSSFLVGLANGKDAHHESALDIQSAIEEGHWNRVLLHEYIFLETVTVLMARRTLPFASEFGRYLLRAREIEFIPSSEFFLSAWDEFRSQSVDELSFADAALIVTARNYGADEIATFDRGFDGLDNLRVVPER